MFLKGRTEALRTVTAEVKAFLEAFCNPDSSKVCAVGSFLWVYEYVLRVFFVYSVTFKLSVCIRLSICLSAYVSVSALSVCLYVCLILTVLCSLRLYLLQSPVVYCSCACNKPKLAVHIFGVPLLVSCLSMSAFSTAL